LKVISSELRIIIQKLTIQENGVSPRTGGFYNYYY